MLRCKKRDHGRQKKNCYFGFGAVHTDVVRWVTESRFRIPMNIMIVQT